MLNLSLESGIEYQFILEWYFHYRWLGCAGMIYSEFNSILLDFSLLGSICPEQEGGVWSGIYNQATENRRRQVKTMQAVRKNKPKKDPKPHSKSEDEEAEDLIDP